LFTGFRWSIGADQGHGSRQSPVFQRRQQRFHAGLFTRGYKEADVAAVMGGNWLRCIEKFCG
jgi:microsomal dipeptidase-like Zn-dependent dipeptidase